MAQVKPIHKIRAAAHYFVFISRNLKRIATDFRVQQRTVQRWAKEPEWTEVLDACDYKGPREFELQPYRDTERDAGDEFSNARKVYLAAKKRGEPRHKLAAITEAKTGIPRKKIGTWARKHGWRETED